MGTAELVLILPIRKYSWVLQNLYLYYRYGSTHRYYRTCAYITDTEVLVGTTELVLILPIRKYSWVLQNLYLYYRYESTRRYYRDFTCTKVLVGTTQIYYTELLVGTTGLILILPIREYP